jgi:hypothetical protein
MKKIISLTAAIALLLTSTVSGASAYYGHRHHRDIGDRMTTTNTALIESAIYTSANTGYNVQGNLAENESFNNGPVLSFSFDRFSRHHRSYGDVEVGGNNMLLTGHAMATSISDIQANNTYGCGCLPEISRHSRHGTTMTLRNDATVFSVIQTDANTGYNVQGNIGTSNGSSDVEVDGHNTMDTGNATSTSDSTIVVNTQWSMMP